jgi:hypothetical protein
MGKKCLFSTLCIGIKQIDHLIDRREMDKRWTRRGGNTIKLVSMEEAARQIQSGDFVGVGLGIGACSPEMYEAILARHAELEGVRICDAVQVRPSRLYDPEVMKPLDGHINFAPCFGTALIRKSTRKRLPTSFQQQLRRGRNYGKIADDYLHKVTPPQPSWLRQPRAIQFLQHEAQTRGKGNRKQRVTIGEVNDRMPVIFETMDACIQFDFLCEHSPPCRR